VEAIGREILLSLNNPILDQKNSLDSSRKNPIIKQLELALVF